MTFHYTEWNPAGTKTLVLLHGFTGSDRSFEAVIPFLSKDIRVIAPLLPGHGREPFPLTSFAMENQIDWLHHNLQNMNLTHFTLAGYSMGGRLALGYALKHPVKRLILISSSPGIKDAKERLQRAEADSELARRIEENGLEAFVNYWEDIPLFATQKQLPEEIQKGVRKERLSHDAGSLVKSLRQFSTGNMPNYWPLLEKYSQPVHLIVGERDEKFVGINQEMQLLFQNSTLTLVNQVGHAIQVENPKMFATIIEEYILKEEIS